MDRTDEPAFEIFRSRKPPGPGLFGGIGMGEDEGGGIIIERMDDVSPAFDGRRFIGPGLLADRPERMDGERSRGEPRDLTLPVSLNGRRGGIISV